MVGFETRLFDVKGLCAVDVRDRNLDQLESHFACHLDLLSLAPAGYALPIGASVAKYFSI